MVSSMAQPCVRRTMGCKPQRIGIVLALQSLGADLREAFDVVAHHHERADAFEKGFSVERVCWSVGRAGPHPETYLRDLAGAGADGHVKCGFVVDDERLD